LEYLMAGGKSERVNLGTGKGYSVLDVIKACEEACGQKIKVVDAPRREGDAPALVAKPEKAQKLLNFTCQRSDIKTICADAWRWHSSHPHGYKSSVQELAAH